MGRFYGQLWLLAVSLGPFLQSIYGLFASYEPFSLPSLQYYSKWVSTDGCIPGFVVFQRGAGVCR